ncbi:UNVERIFIED_CONTAM: hypothetical protein K2H54_053910 [Gekko kuhli]
MAEDTKCTADLKECEEDSEERIFEINDKKKNRHSFGQESNNIQADKTTFTLYQQNTPDEKNGEVPEKRPMVWDMYCDMEKDGSGLWTEDWIILQDKCLFKCERCDILLA